MIEAAAVGEYLRFTGEESLDASKFDVVDSIEPTDPAAFVKLENSSL